MKQRYSVFVGTLLGEMLREQSIRTVVLVGLTTDICVSSTARDGFVGELLAHRRGLITRHPPVLQTEAHGAAPAAIATWVDRSAVVAATVAHSLN